MKQKEYLYARIVSGTYLEIKESTKTTRIVLKKRETIREFSVKSRIRFKKEILKYEIDIKKFSLVTLTLHPDQKLLYKKAFKRFRTKIERKFGKVPCFWKLEFTQNEIPHYHLLYAKYVPKKTIQDIWTRSVGSKALTRIEGIRNSKGIAGYLAQYLGKEEQSKIPADFGGARFWGIWNKENLVKRKIFNVPIMNKTRNELIQIARLGKENCLTKTIYYYEDVLTINKLFNNIWNDAFIP